MTDLTIKSFFENFANMIFVKEMYYAQRYFAPRLPYYRTHIAEPARCLIIFKTEINRVIKFQRFFFYIPTFIPWVFNEILKSRRSKLIVYQQLQF